MDRKLARANMRFGISLFVLLMALLASTFMWYLGAKYLGYVK
jgi:hypothetical protein